MNTAAALRVSFFSLALQVCYWVNYTAVHGVIIIATRRLICGLWDWRAFVVLNQGALAKAVTTVTQAATEALAVTRDGGQVHWLTGHVCIFAWFGHKFYACWQTPAPAWLPCARCNLFSACRGKDV